MYWLWCKNGISSKFGLSPVLHSKYAFFSNILNKCMVVGYKGLIIAAYLLKESVPGSCRKELLLIIELWAWWDWFIFCSSFFGWWEVEAVCMRLVAVCCCWKWFSTCWRCWSLVYVVLMCSLLLKVSYCVGKIH